MGGLLLLVLLRSACPLHSLVAPISPLPFLLPSVCSVTTIGSEFRQLTLPEDGIWQSGVEVRSHCGVALLRCCSPYMIPPQWAAHDAWKTCRGLPCQRGLGLLQAQELICRHERQLRQRQPGEGPKVRCRSDRATSQISLHFAIRPGRGLQRVRFHNLLDGHPRLKVQLCSFGLRSNTSFVRNRLGKKHLDTNLLGASFFSLTTYISVHLSRFTYLGSPYLSSYPIHIIKISPLNFSLQPQRSACIVRMSPPRPFESPGLSPEVVVSRALAVSL
ncbi:hypothetical protein FPQ18DRAFT_35119 [Pyronema domesticum]|nr:hypothetical protein FPQ18DRAFT_35119 [Pyronema domesticum]